MINPQTHGMVLSVLFDDLLERPDEITLPVLLTIARTPTHPLAPEARDNLELLLGTNFGADWMKWTQRFDASWPHIAEESRFRARQEPRWDMSIKRGTRNAERVKETFRS